MYSGILAIKKNEIMPFVATWMDLLILILSEVNLTKINIIWHCLYVESRKKWYKWIYLLPGSSPSRIQGFPQDGRSWRAKERETELRWSRSVTLFLKRAFIPWVVHRGEWKMQSHAGSAVLTLIETRLSFCIPFHIQRSYVIYIIFWPGGLLTFYDPFFW